MADALAVGTRLRLGDPAGFAALVAQAVANGPYLWPATVRLLLPLEEARRRASPTTGLLESEAEDSTLAGLGAEVCGGSPTISSACICRFEVIAPPELLDECTLGTDLQDLDR
ncbi:MAG TPA: hypothetical protein VHF25_08560 [Nitriliruptorales bacterium]|nr:hypothetical protein [Nitriliruptorales bacterium]